MKCIKSAPRVIIKWNNFEKRCKLDADVELKEKLETHKKVQRKNWNKIANEKK